MLEDMINENFRIIAESIKLIEDRFERITLSDDFVSNADGIFVLYPKPATRNSQPETRNRQNGINDSRSSLL